MPNRRLEIHRVLCNILDCPEIGDECRCHFQPDSNVRLKYPVIIYKLQDLPMFYADNIPYLGYELYELTLIDRNPESLYVSCIAALPKAKFVRFFVSDNLNHWVFQIH